MLVSSRSRIKLLLLREGNQTPNQQFPFPCWGQWSVTWWGLSSLLQLSQQHRGFCWFFFSFFRYKACHKQAPLLGGRAGPHGLESLKLEPLLHQAKYLVLLDLAVRFYRTENSGLAGSQRSHVQNSYPRENWNFSVMGLPSSSKGKHVTQERPM